MKIFKTFKFFFIFFILTSFVWTVRSSALEIISPKTLSLDTSIKREDKNYTLPQGIVVVPIFLPNNDLDINQEEWFKGLYYFTIQKLGFSDMPFHYVVSSEGNVYVGNEGGDERKISIQGVGENLIVIAYLALPDENTFSPKAESVLKELILNVANNNSITPAETTLSGIKFSRDTTNKTVTMEAAEVFGLWSTSLSKVVGQIVAQYSPVSKEYMVEVMSVTLPTEEVNPGDEVVGSVKIKNVGNNMIYAGTDAEIIASKEAGGSSGFFLNNIWLSTSDFALMAEDQTLTKNEEVSFDFKLKAPLYFGDYTENFVIKTIKGQTLSDTTFQIKLKMKRTDKKIVEIDTKQYDFIYARVNPYQGAETVRNLVTGERFFLLNENLDTGWIQLDLGGGVTGWIAYWYAIYL